MEFKRLSDVDVVTEPTDAANVLVEENGVIMKAPKIAVGGGGKPDIVVKCSQYMVEGTAPNTEINNAYYDFTVIKNKFNTAQTVIANVELELYGVDGNLVTKWYATPIMVVYDPIRNYLNVLVNNLYDPATGEESYITNIYIYEDGTIEVNHW